MTIEEAKQEIKEYLQDADKAIGEDEEYIRGWKSAMLVALELLNKLCERGKMEKRITTIEFLDEEIDEILKLMGNGEFETIQEAIMSVVRTYCGKEEVSNYYLGGDNKWHKKDW